MELNTRDRLQLLSLLPRTGDIISLRILRDLEKDLGFSEVELSALNLRVTEGGGMQWDATADKPKEVEVGENALSLVRKTLKELSETKKLQLSQVELYDRFVEAK